MNLYKKLNVSISICFILILSFVIIRYNCVLSKYKQENEIQLYNIIRLEEEKIVKVPTTPTVSMVGNNAYSNQDYVEVKEENEFLREELEKYKDESCDLERELDNLQEFINTNSSTLKQLDKSTYALLYFSNYEFNCYDYNITESQFSKLCVVTESEIGGGTFEAKLNVVSSIINRMKEEDKDLDELLSEGYSTAWSNPSENTILAVKYILAFGVNNDSLYFCAITTDSSWHNKQTFLFSDNYHKFYR